MSTTFEAPAGATAAALRSCSGETPSSRRAAAFSVAPDWMTATFVAIRRSWSAASGSVVPRTANSGPGSANSTCDVARYSGSRWLSRAAAMPPASRPQITTRKACRLSATRTPVVAGSVVGLMVRSLQTAR